MASRSVVSMPIMSVTSSRTNAGCAATTCMETHRDCQHPHAHGHAQCSWPPSTCCTAHLGHLGVDCRAQEVAHPVAVLARDAPELGYARQHKGVCGLAALGGGLLLRLLLNSLHGHRSRLELQGPVQAVQQLLHGCCVVLLGRLQALCSAHTTGMSTHIHSEPPLAALLQTHATHTHRSPPCP